MANKISSTTYTRNIGFNKGRPRLWLEKAILTDNGFKVGDKITVSIEAVGRMNIDVNPEGNRKVSGKGDRPIIDLTGKILEEAGFDGVAKVQITAVSNMPGHLIVTKAHK